MSREAAASISRRQFMRRAGWATGLAAAGLGTEGILAARKAPARCGFAAAFASSRR